MYTVCIVHVVYCIVYTQCLYSACTYFFSACIMCLLCLLCIHTVGIYFRIPYTYHTQYNIFYIVKAVTLCSDPQQKH